MKVMIDHSLRLTREEEKLKKALMQEDSKKFEEMVGEDLFELDESVYTRRVLMMRIKKEVTK